MTDLLSRKFLLAVGVIAATFALVVLNKTDASEFIRLAEIALGIYTAGNIGADVANRK